MNSNNILGFYCFMLTCLVSIVLAIPTWLVFIILKICGVIVWNWLVICIPLFIAMALGLSMFVSYMIAKGTQ